MLIVEDKLSMAYGLETRVPFLDNDLVDFAMRIPVRLKLSKLQSIEKLNENEYGNKPNKYYERNKDGKLILRNVMEKYIPREVSNGAKQGFSAPDASWFRGESIDYVKSIISNSNAKMYKYINKKYVESIFRKHTSGEENKRLLIWSIINFNEWIQMFMV